MLPVNTELLLLDREPPRDDVPLPSGARWLPPAGITDRDALVRVLDEYRPSEVIELAAVGTWDCLTACAEYGASYLTTSYDAWPQDLRDDPVAARCMLRSRALHDPPDVDAGVHLLCMGMNPGLINLLVERGITELAQRSGRPPSLEALELAAVLFTELDQTTTTTPLDAPSERFISTWSPSGCLDEVLEPTAMMIVCGDTAELDHPPHTAVYEARCGDELICGHIVPHEELVSLALMYPTLDLAYVYRMSPPAEAALAAVPERGAHDWPTGRLYPPEHLHDLRGFNRIGALLCSRSLGELWIGWQTAVEDARAYSTNATLLQVATGVLAGWPQLSAAPPGVYLPEDLDGDRILAAAEQVLGPLRVVWDPHAPLRRVADRRVG